MQLARRSYRDRDGSILRSVVDNHELVLGRRDIHPRKGFEARPKEPFPVVADDNHARSEMVRDGCTSGLGPDALRVKALVGRCDRVPSALRSDEDTARHSEGLAPDRIAKA